MNQQHIKTYLQAYKNQFTGISKVELYKWKAVKQFQDHWNIDAEDFYEMAKTSLSKVKNLMDVGNYFPKRMVLRNIEVAPEEVRKLFKELFNEEDDILQRIVHFQNQFIALNRTNFSEKKHFQDHRAIVVYLTLKFPDRYFFYKFGMFDDFIAKIDYPYKPIMGRIENIAHFENICLHIKYLITQDQDLLRLRNSHLTDDCYIDESLHILTQDFIYAVAYHIEELNKPFEDKEEISIEYITGEVVSVVSSNINFNPSITNHLQTNKENKRIGDLGELFVVQFEKEKLEKANKPKLAKKVAHHAKDKGDGLGYDVLSFDVNGNEMYIEVKTSKGNKKVPFFITRNELERSKEEQDRFYLYRVYNFDDEKVTGDILVIQGDATSLCIEPINYKVKMN